MSFCISHKERGIRLEKATQKGNEKCFVSAAVQKKVNLQNPIWCNGSPSHHCKFDKFTNFFIGRYVVILLLFFHLVDWIIVVGTSVRTLYQKRWTDDIDDAGPKQSLKDLVLQGFVNGRLRDMCSSLYMGGTITCKSGHRWKQWISMPAKVGRDVFIFPNLSSDRHRKRKTVCKSRRWSLQTH